MEGWNVRYHPPNSNNENNSENSNKAKLVKDQNQKPGRYQNTPEFFSDRYKQRNLKERAIKEPTKYNFKGNKKMTAHDRYLQFLKAEVRNAGGSTGLAAGKPTYSRSEFVTVVPEKTRKAQEKLFHYSKDTPDAYSKFFNREQYVNTAYDRPENYGNLTNAERGQLNKTPYKQPNLIPVIHKLQKLQKVKLDENSQRNQTYQYYEEYEKPESQSHIQESQGQLRIPDLKKEIGKNHFENVQRMTIKSDIDKIDNNYNVQRSERRHFQQITKSPPTYSHFADYTPPPPVPAERKIRNPEKMREKSYQRYYPPEEGFWLPETNKDPYYVNNNKDNNEQEDPYLNNRKKYNTKPEKVLNNNRPKMVNREQQIEEKSHNSNNQNIQIQTDISSLNKERREKMRSNQSERPRPQQHPPHPFHLKDPNPQRQNKSHNPAEKNNERDNVTTSSRRRAHKNNNNENNKNKSGSGSVNWEKNRKNWLPPPVLQANDYDQNSMRNNHHHSSNGIINYNKKEYVSSNSNYKFIKLWREHEEQERRRVEKKIQEEQMEQLENRLMNSYLEVPYPTKKDKKNRRKHN